ncbi:hypothetical protein SSX86_004429 [Deinandra increscens subsp. villosa]|uniref:F-box domain-containing protein n=1 Tax=Deinandra increscens subsp. villosa TaxID=3103831 RepID=A0AAP0H8U6_9ASTR
MSSSSPALLKTSPMDIFYRKIFNQTFLLTRNRPPISLNTQSYQLQEKERGDGTHPKEQSSSTLPLFEGVWKAPASFEDMKKKEKELQAREADLKKREETFQSQLYHEMEIRSRLLVSLWSCTLRPYPDWLCLWIKVFAAGHEGVVNGQPQFIATQQVSNEFRVWRYDFGRLELSTAINRRWSSTATISSYFSSEIYPIVAKRLSMDIISTLPQTILEIILCLLPTEEAARTSILSREWRYKWVKIPKLNFHHDPHSENWYRSTTRESMDMRCKTLYKIHQVLLLHQGPIHELTIHPCIHCECFDFDRIILHLAKNHTVKKLAIDGWDDRFRFDLPISIFSLHHLTDLHLSCVTIDLEHEPVFNEFGSLRSLVLDLVEISTKSLLHLLSNCPSLKSFHLCACNTLFDEYCTIIELFKCLPVIEHLTIYGQDLRFSAVPQELPRLCHLKYFCFDLMSFIDSFGLPFLLVVIKCSPNLEKIKLEIDEVYCVDSFDDNGDEECFVVWEEYSDVWLDHLIELEIEWFSNLKPEMDFVKFILARSPKLKMVRIRTQIDRAQDPEMLKTLLRAPRASPVLINVN